jgi:hypothetical protein
MINKNVYIFFPAGYHGTYLKWAIEVSDLDSRKKTVLDPVNYQSTEKFGGPGTAHLMGRIPTHQSSRSHQQWMILNKPVDPNIYLINSSSANNKEKDYDGITDLLFEDRDGVVIVIHSDQDPEIESYGNINCVTKWPSYVDTVFATTRHSDEYKQEVDKFLNSGFRAINSADNRDFRNFLIKYNLLRPQPPLNLDALDKSIEFVQKWYTARNFAQPHEVNEDTYISEIKNIEQRVFQVNCRDIPSTKFLDIFANIMTTAKISNHWDTVSLQKVHQKYIDAQPNLQWFESFRRWKNTGELDNYLTSHSVIESEIIKHIFKESNFSLGYGYYDRARWLTFYSNISEPDWPNPPDSEKKLNLLPEWIQDEILNKFNFESKYLTLPAEEIANLDWEHMSLVEINKVYQKTRTQ